MKILFLEDEYTLRISVEEFLEDIGYEVNSYSDGLQAYEAIFDKQYDLLLLDINVPTISGFEVLENLEKEKIHVPTIFLTAMTDLQNLKKGYEVGCCDYVRKPFDLEELEVRIHQVIKNFYHYDSDVVDLGNQVKYDLTQGRLSINDKEVVLRKTEKEIFELLIKNRNIVVSLEMIQDAIWGDYVEPATIRVQLKNLRKKLPDGIINNRRGLGYIIE